MNVSLADTRPGAVLNSQARLRTSEDFRRTVRQGVRVGRDTLVVHALRSEGSFARAGFVVSKAVGNAVTRNRVKRQLRHLTAPRLASAPFPVDVVVRALPEASSGNLAGDLASAWDASMRRLVAA